MEMNSVGAPGRYPFCIIEAEAAPALFLQRDCIRIELQQLCASLSNQFVCNYRARALRKNEACLMDAIKYYCEKH
jgi:hypothetical protein